MTPLNTQTQIGANREAPSLQRGPDRRQSWPESLPEAGAENASVCRVCSFQPGGLCGQAAEPALRFAELRVGVIWAPAASQAFRVECFQGRVLLSQPS